MTASEFPLGSAPSYAGLSRTSKPSCASFCSLLVRKNPPAVSSQKCASSVACKDWAWASQRFLPLAVKLRTRARQRRFEVERRDRQALGDRVQAARSREDRTALEVPFVADAIVGGDQAGIAVPEHGCELRGRPGKKPTFFAHAG